jgi:hypothetical protein
MAVLDAARPVTVSRPVQAELVQRTVRRHSDRGARVVVWSSWLAMTVSTAIVILHGARNIPIQEDWHVIPAFTGHQSHFLGWLWKQNNEHRVPVPKLIYVGLLKLWPDFRVGMIFSMVVAAAIAAAFVIVLRRIRGRTRWTDAFFPVAFLHLGHWENLGWSWELQFVVATAFACALLMVTAMTTEWTTRRAIVAGGCLVAIPLSGATAFAFAPIMVVALIPVARRTAQPAKGVLIGSMAMSMGLTGLYFVGLKHPDWVTPSPSPWASFQAGLKFLALAVGPAAGAWWLPSVVLIAAILGSAAFLLFRARRQGAVVLLAYLVAAIVLAASLGQGRAGLIPVFGLPDRYALIAVPGLCCCYLAYERYGHRLRRWGPPVLCVGMVALIPLNTNFGLQYRDWYHYRVDNFAADVKAGMPLDQLNDFRPIAAESNEMWFSMLYLQSRRIGVFRYLQVQDRRRLVMTPIDGFATESGWQTIGGPASAATFQGEGADVALRWEYDATAQASAVVGRAFAGLQDWRGSGAIAITLTGQGSGRRIRVRVAVQTPSGSTDRYDGMIVDDTAATRTVVIPWNGVGHSDASGKYDWQGPMPLDRIESFVFIVTDPGRGQLVVHRVSLVPGHGQLGWPFHPAANRRSLPPWR